MIEHGLDRGAATGQAVLLGPVLPVRAPAGGRYRQLQQVGVEAIGVDDPALDAEVIAIADAGFRSLGLTGFRLEITSLGDDTAARPIGSCCGNTCFGSISVKPARQRAESTRCGCSTTSARRCGR